MRIRPAESRDAEPIAAIYRPYVAGTVITFETDPPSADEFRRRMSGPEGLPMPWLVAEERSVDPADAGRERVVGYAYASRHRDRAAYRWSADVSIYLDLAIRGRGIGRALYAALIPRVRALGYFSLYAGITVPNPASVGIHESMGFRFVGVYRSVGYKAMPGEPGRWLDVAWYELAAAGAAGDPGLVGEPGVAGLPNPPAEPLAWDAPQ